MKPAQLPEIVLKRGIYWPGRTLRCFADLAQTTPSTLTDWVPVMQVRAKPGGEVLWEFEVSISGQDVIMAPRSGAQNLELQPVKRVYTQLSFVNALGRPVGPYAECPVTVKDEISVPPVS